MGGGAGSGSGPNGSVNGTGGAGGSGVVLVKLNPVFAASNVWSLRQVFQEVKADNWGEPS
jgi:hypothetical protein